MKAVILGASRFRQYFTLELKRHASEDEPVFEIEGCLAVGWVMGRRSAEEVWRLGR